MFNCKLARRLRYVAFHKYARSQLELAIVVHEMQYVP
jgi:hypothetical protein